MRLSSDTSNACSDNRPKEENHLEFKCGKKVVVGQGNIWEETELQIISLLWNFWPDPNDTLYLTLCEEV